MSLAEEVSNLLEARYLLLLSYNFEMCIRKGSKIRPIVKGVSCQQTQRRTPFHQEGVRGTSDGYKTAACMPDMYHTEMPRADLVEAVQPL